MLEHLPGQTRGNVSAVMFNLGYLPHGDKKLVTKPDTTSAALDASLTLLKKGGVISILSYRGHAGGMEEFEKVQEWIASQGDHIDICVEQDSDHPQSTGPYLWILQKH